MKLYSKEEVEIAVKSSKCWREVIKHLNPDNKGYRGSESNIKKTAIKFGIDFSHFPGSNWSRGKALGPKRPIEDYFNGIPIQSNILKNRIIKEGIKKEQCELCGLEKWLDRKIFLELHHKDLNHKNNQLENLQVLCSNCHSYKHQKDPSQRQEEETRKLKLKRVVKRKKSCLLCGKAATNKYCSYKCTKASRKSLKMPISEDLKKMIWEKPSAKIAKELGVSDSIIVKWCRKFNIEKPPRGYWSKTFNGQVDESETGRSMSLKMTSP